MRTHTRPALRAAFTLVELLFVLVIILVLIALSAGAVMKIWNLGPYSATVTNINKIKSAFDTQWRAILDKAKQEFLPSGYPGNKADPTTRQNYINEKLAQAFPTQFMEVFTGAPNLGPWSGYVSYLATLNVTAANVGSVTNSVEEQEAICLLMALEHGPLHTAQSADALGISAVQKFIVSVTKPSPMSASASGCADAWGRPLRFTRAAPVPDPTKPVPALMSAGPAILSYGKDGKPTYLPSPTYPYLPAPPYPAMSGIPVWLPNPDIGGNDDISSLNQ